MDRGLRHLYAATVLYGLSQAMALPLVPTFLAREHDASVAFVGAVMGVSGLMQIALRLPMGDMADRRGRRPSLVLSFACLVGAALVLLLPGSAWWAVPGVALLGFAAGVYWVAANAYLFDRAGEDVARATSDYGVAIGLAFLAGPALGHLLAALWGFEAAFAASALVGLAGLALVVRLPEEPPAHRPRPSESVHRRAWRLLRHPALLASALGTLVHSLLFGTLAAFFQLHALAVGVGVALVGVLLAARQAAATAARFRLPRVLARFGARNVLLVGVAGLAVSVLLVPFARTPATLALVTLLGGLASGVAIPANLMLVSEGAPAGERGLANGIYGTMVGVGSMAAPFLFGAVGERFGLPWTFWSAGLVSLGALLATTIVMREARPSAATSR